MNKFHDLELSHLKTFFTVAKTRSFTEAGKKLFISQSAVSHSVKKLETQCAVRLFTRRKKDCRLTEAGEILFAACEKIFFNLDLALNQITSLRKDFAGTIRIGAPVEFGSTVLVKYLKDFIETYPRLNIDIMSKHDPFSLLLKEDLDIVIDCQEHIHPKIEKQRLFNEPFIAVASPRYLEKNEIKTHSDLESCRILSLDKNGLWWSRFLEKLAPEEKIKFRTVIQINHIRGIINACLNDYGVGLIPQYCILSELQNRKLVNIFPEEENPADTFFIYYFPVIKTDLRHKKLIEYFVSLEPYEFPKMRR
jgi:DNA-binding transcriptional LysR family regulator